MYYITDAAGNRVPAEKSGDLIRVESITADTTLTREDSGKTYLLDAVGEVITLPALADGLSFKFRCIAATTTTDWTIVSSTDVIEGYVAVNYATIVGANENTISLVATKAIIGDTVEVFCDGTSWHASGYASVAAAITFTAP